jgi:DNA-binding transcriptional regulator YhcF (GntR family)
MKYRSIKNPPGQANIRLDDAVQAANALSRRPIEPAKGRYELKKRLSLSRKRPGSMLKQVTDQMDWLIRTGSLRGGTYLPTERELANSLHVARNVVRGSYEHLMRAGRIEIKDGKIVTARGAKKKNSASRSKKSRKPSSKRPGSTKRPPSKK